MEDILKAAPCRSGAFLLLLPALALLTACESLPETYAPPVQRQPFESFRPYRVTRVVDMSDGDADDHIVRNIPTNGTGSWRWTGQQPTVRVTIRRTEDLLYTIDFTVADATFKSTGPVTLTFLVNGHTLDSAHYTAAGSYHFEKPVPADWLVPGKDATIGAAIDKMWVSPKDGVKLGFILSRIGLQDSSKQ